MSILISNTSTNTNTNTSTNTNTTQVETIDRTPEDKPGGGKVDTGKTALASKGSENSTKSLQIVYTKFITKFSTCLIYGIFFVTLSYFAG